MLEQPNGLFTIQLAVWPPRVMHANHPQTIQTRRIPDHRLAYLEYEGEISAGRGHVLRVLAGHYQPLREQRHPVTGETSTRLRLLADNFEAIIQWAKCEPNQPLELTIHRWTAPQPPPPNRPN